MMAEQVNHPSHYGGGDNPYEAIKVLKAWLSPEAYRGFLLGNALKYLSRQGKKGESLTDLQKAQWYLSELIKEQTTEKQQCSLEAYVEVLRAHWESGCGDG